MQKYSKVNDGFRYILTVIDCFSKYAWAVPVKNKEAKTVLDAFKYIVKTSKRVPKHLWVDEGKEFYNSSMTAWINNNGITRYSTHGAHKSAIVERFNRTLKTKMWRKFTEVENTVWVKGLLDELLVEYNNVDVHRTIGMPPARASLAKNAAVVATKLRVEKGGVGRLKVGDTVRISLVKGVFDKGFEANWSEEVYVVESVKNTSPVSYTIKDLQGEPMLGRFYEEELQKTTQSMYRIEKVLNRKIGKDGVEMVRVKWKGYPDKFNQWIKKSDVDVTDTASTLKVKDISSDKKIDQYFKPV